MLTLRESMAPGAGTRRDNGTGTPATQAPWASGLNRSGCLNQICVHQRNLWTIAFGSGCHAFAAQRRRHAVRTISRYV
ncbi:MAG: hypothetical protein Fues2KO_28030 [Fuerstiella sp.]